MTSCRARVSILAFSLVACASAAIADIAADCRQSRRADLKVQACSAIIDNPTTAAGDRAVALRHRADARNDAGAYKDAIADFSETLRIVPDNVPALTGRAQARLTGGDVAGALADLNAAIALAPNTAQLFLLRGHAELANGNTDAAIVDFTEAIRLDPKSASALNNRGLAYRKKGDLAKAEADYTAALALNPMYGLAYANRGYVLEAQGRKDEAIESLRQAVLVDPSLVSAREALNRLGVTNTSAAESKRRVALGKDLATANCSRCHAVGASGTSTNAKAPEFRNLKQRHPLLSLREPLTRGIAAQHDEMPRFPLSLSEIDAIVAYVNSL